MKTLITLGMLILFTTQAGGQTRICGQTKKLFATLKKHYQEEPKFMGVSTGGRTFLTIFISSKGTYTVVSTGKGGLSCIAWAGNDWHQIAKKADKGM